VDDEDFDSHTILRRPTRWASSTSIFQFQKALRGATQRIRAYEALGQCFIDRNEYDVASPVLGRALRSPGMETGSYRLLYLLGFASEGSKEGPRCCRVLTSAWFAIDIDSAT